MTARNTAMGVAALVWALSACAAAPEEAAPNPGPRGDSNPVAAVAGAALGEPGCLTLPADGIYQPQGVDAFSSPPDYGRPGCRDGFIVDAELLDGDLIAVATTTATDSADFFNVLTCGFHSVTRYLYKKNSSGNYILFDHRVSFGKWSFRGLGATLYCSINDIRPPPGDGEYRIIVAANDWAGRKLPVSIRISD